MNTTANSSNSIPLGLNLGLWDRMTNWDEAVETARLAHSVGIPGSVSDCQARVDQLLISGTDRLVVTMPAATRAECEPVLAGIIPARFR